MPSSDTSSRAAEGSQHSVEIAKLEMLVRYARAFMASGRPSLSVEELAKLWNKSIDEAKSIIRKLRREGFVRRTRRGRYRLTLAGSLLVRLFERIRRE